MVNPPPLAGLKVIEFAGLAPGPFAGMLLADAGASVLRIDRAATEKETKTETGSKSKSKPLPADMLTRHKSSIRVDLKSPSGAALIRHLAAQADVLIDPFRPGVLEKLGLGPSDLLPVNPRLIYARMTGFRRDGRYAAMAGHDINYLAVSGALSLLGRAGAAPHPPVNILADFAGGGATLVQGILLALVTRQASGRGQVIEANMVDGASYLATLPRLGLKTPLGDRGRGNNLLDGGCPFYDTYETAEGKYVAIGALEPQFYAELVKGLGLAGQGWEETRDDRESWPEMRKVFSRIFKSRTRDEWETVFDGTDACCTPVLEYAELEAGADREGDQRPAVGLRDTPLLGVVGNARDAGAQGQGPGIPGAGYVGFPLTPGEGGKEILEKWMGWRLGKEYEMQAGGLVLKAKL